MKLLSDKILGFLRIAELGSVSRAAKAMGLAQPSLTKRLQLLESELEVKLTRRTPRGIELTSDGQNLFSTLRQIARVEEEYRKQNQQGQEGALSGKVTIAGLSSQIHSVLIPVLGELLRSNPLVQIEFLTRQAKLLPSVLLRHEADFVIMDQVVEKKDIVSVELGKEKFVAVRHRSLRTRLDTFLDTDPEDPITEKFFRIQAKQKRMEYRRSYMHDTNGIISGLVNGLGCAILEERLIPRNAPLETIKGFRPLTVPVTLNYHQHAFYTKLQLAVISEIKKAQKFF